MESRRVKPPPVKLGDVCALRAEWWDASPFQSLFSLLCVLLLRDLPEHEAENFLGQRWRLCLPLGFHPAPSVLEAP